jgi:hypothetical protein
MADKLNLISNLSKDNTGSSTVLKYPNEQIEKHSDYVMFQFYQYNGPFSGNTGGGYESIEGTTLNKDFFAYNESNKDYAVYPDSSNVILYMPEDIQTQYGASWGGKDFSNIGAEALKASGGALAGDIGKTFNAVGKLIQNAAGALPTMGAQAVSDAINASGAGNVDTNDVLGASLGVILNPNTELMFSGFKMREFNMRFKLVPRNKKEAGDIRKIIAQFKKVMLPTLAARPGGSLDWVGAAANKPAPLPANANDGENLDTSKLTGSNANYIGVPGLCQVKFMKGSQLHPYIPQYKVCAITGVDVNYTPDGVYATYYDGEDGTNGAPVAVEMNLSFAETKLVYSQDIVSDGATY